MPVHVVSHLTSDDDDDTSKDLMTFCMQLVHHSQWKSQRKLMCGSTVENPCFLMVAEYIRLSTDMLDVDLMIYDTSRYAVHRSVSLPETYTGDIARIYTDNVHTGYVRLIREKNNKELMLSDLYTMKDNEMKHGPAILTDNKRIVISMKHSLSCEYLDVVENERKSIPLQDKVFAVHGPYWPVEATEWITRRRSHGFPSKSVIKQVVRYGCDFVQVSHNRLGNDGEWRFSFSKAELIIIKSWTISQRIVYSTLWALNKRIAISNLCTYYFKTLMFWACEEKSSQFWSADLIVHTVCELIIEMIKWIKSKFCVNYFIPGNNMLDHLIDTDLSYKIDALWTALKSPQSIAEAIDRCRQCELTLSCQTYNIDSPAWIKRAFVIYQRVNNDFDTYTDLLGSHLTTDLQNSHYIELSDIYRGLCLQQMSVSSVNESDKLIYFLKSESHLLLAVNLHESQERDLIDNCSVEFIIVMTTCHRRHDTDIGASEDNIELITKHRSTADRQNSLNDHNKQKCLLYSRSVEKPESKLVKNYWSEKIIGGKIVNIAVHCLMETITFTEKIFSFYKEWPGRSPTVNISWFIAKAYLANLYYTTQLDVSLTIKTCDDIIDVYRQSMMNEWFAEKTFPVVLSTQWTCIYDKEIQELLGFYSLCSYVFDASSRSVYLGVCPVQFALYLKLRIVRTLASNLWKGIYFYCWENLLISRDINKCINDNNEHKRACRSNQKVINGSVVLKIAFDLFKLKPNK